MPLAAHPRPEIVKYRAFVIGEDEITNPVESSAKAADEDAKYYNLPESSEFSAGAVGLTLLLRESRYFVGADSMETIDGFGWEMKDGCIAVEGLNEKDEVVVRHEFIPSSFDRDILEDPGEGFPTFYLGDREFTKEELEARGETKKSKFSMER